MAFLLATAASCRRKVELSVPGSLADLTRLGAGPEPTRRDPKVLARVAGDAACGATLACGRLGRAGRGGAGQRLAGEAEPAPRPAPRIWSQSAPPGARRPVPPGLPPRGSRCTHGSLGAPDPVSRGLLPPGSFLGARMTQSGDPKGTPGTRWQPRARTGRIQAGGAATPAVGGRLG